MEIGNTAAEFLREWYGPPSHEPVPDSAHGPRALCDWWAYEDAWPIPLTRQNRVLAPMDVYRDDGRSVFYVENQAVWLWAFGDGDDPDVYERENEQGVPWVAVGERLSTFIHHVAVFEAVLGAQSTLAANDVDGTVVREALGQLSPSPFIDWRWPGPHSSVREGEDCLVFSCVNDRPGSDVDETSSWMFYVAGRTAEALSAFDSVGIAWDYESR